MVVKFPTNVIEPWQLLPRVNREGLPQKAQQLGQKPKGVDHARVDVLVDCWSDTQVRLSLKIFEIELFRLQFEIRDALTFWGRRSMIDGRDSDIFDALWDVENSQIIQGREEREIYGGQALLISVDEYISLRPFGLITDFFVHKIERGSGVGKAWYLEIVEPFLRQSGVPVVGAKGSCLEAEADEFWKKMGFARILPYDYEFDTDILRSFRFKLLN